MASHFEANTPETSQRRLSIVTKKEKQHLENLEECFEQLQYAYESSQTQIKKLNEKIEILKNHCRENFIKIPQLDEPF